MGRGLRTFVDGGWAYVPTETLFKVYAASKAALEERDEAKEGAEVSATLAALGLGLGVWIWADTSRAHLAKGSAKKGFTALCGRQFWLTTRQIKQRLRDAKLGYEVVHSRRCGNCTRTQQARLHPTVNEDSPQTIREFVLRHRAEVEEVLQAERQGSS